MEIAKGHARQPTALTIAGFDPGTGAGITADLLTFARFGLFASSAITALTVQSTRGVRRVQPVDPALLRDMLEELEADLPADGVKIGMLGGAPQVRVVADFLTAVRRRRAIAVVLDPVLVSSSGAILLDASGLEMLQTDLLPLVDALTPNAPEAALLTGLPCGNAREAEQCARTLAERYPRLVPVVTGGHLETPRDLVWQQGSASWIPGERLSSRATHGTGCAFSSALLAAHLHGEDWPRAAATAKRFVAEAIRTAVPRGAGCGPMNLLGPAPASRSSEDEASR
ncbi:bifunctional hydroxymethylpyrimidine kinase/phosphomethylpyrimidine kinase [Terriglobus sp.]|uniref:bifunctional hydroxymethylpyrimidine kinase/phosphomethylpyrimidine kinase n=1 Tax=Terriglobus sp. TaxID=1889013 RepID=UPI003B007693